jgi:PAS domain S-box-containing protein
MELDFYQILFQSSPFACALLDKNKKIIKSNNVFNSIFEKQSLKDFFEENFVKIEENLQTLIKNKKGDNKRFYLSKNIKNRLLVYDVSVFLVSKNPLKWGIIIINTSLELENIKKLSEKALELKNEKEQQEKLKKINEKLRDFELAIENSSNSIIITSIDGNIEYVNRGFETNMGYTRQEVLGKNSTLLQSVEPENKIYQEINKTIKQKNTFVGDLKNKKKNGEIVWERATVSPIFDENGKLYKFITVKEDITKERQVRKNLEKSYQTLKILDQKKNDFLSLASHELRTPMTVIKGYADMILNEMFGTVTEKQTKYLKKMVRNINHLLSLVNNMLDLQKLETGKMDFNFKNILIDNFTENLIEDFNNLFNKKEIYLEFINELKLDTQIYFDEQKLLQIFNNLLGNAYKFTNKKSSVKIILSDFKENTEFVLFQVKDRGIGIPEEKISSIFDKFTQVDNPLQRESEGSGLGLSIVKSIIKYAEGDIWVKSEYKKGTTFYFTLPKSKQTSIQPKIFTF